MILLERLLSLRMYKSLKLSLTLVQQQHPSTFLLFHLQRTGASQSLFFLLTLLPFPAFPASLANPNPTRPHSIPYLFRDALQVIHRSHNSRLDVFRQRSSRYCSCSRRQWNPNSGRRSETVLVISLRQYRHRQEPRYFRCC
jgi:hypothetical protein